MVLVTRSQIPVRIFCLHSAKLHQICRGILCPLFCLRTFAGYQLSVYFVDVFISFVRSVVDSGDSWLEVLATYAGQNRRQNGSVVGLSDLVDSVFCSPIITVQP